MEGIKADRTLNMTEDGRVVEVGAPGGILGFCVEGQELHPEALAEFGIRLDEEGKLVLPGAEAAEVQPEGDDKAMEGPDEDKAVRVRETKRRKRG